MIHPINIPDDLLTQNLNHSEIFNQKKTNKMLYV